MKDFFISYHRSDRAWADWIAGVLEGAGYTTVSQAGDLRPGGSAVFDWQKALGRAERTLLVLSPAYMDTLYTQPVWTAAFPTAQDGIPPALGVIVGPCRLEGTLEQLHHADLLGLDEEGASRVLRDAVRSGRKPAERAARLKTMKRRPAFPDSVPASWHLPHARSPYLIGSESLLADIAQAFAGGHRVLLSGPAGVGKTQLAVEYAYQHATQYQHVLWGRAAQLAVLSSDFADFARVLFPRRQGGLDEKGAIATVGEWLQEHTNWLLILDDLADAAAVQRYLPLVPRGHVLITSSTLEFVQDTKLVQAKPFSVEEATNFLLRQTRQQDRAAAAAIGTALHGQPLALSLAAAYLEQTDTTLADYLHSLGKQSTFHANKLHPELSSIWQLAFQRIRLASEAGAALLNLLAFVAPDDIPVALLLDTDVPQLPEAVTGIAADKQGLAQTISLLQRFGALSRQGHSVSIHPLLQALIRKQLGAEAKRWAELALQVVAAAFQVDAEESQARRVFTRLLPHALSVAGHAEALTVAPELTAEILSATGWYFYEQGEYAEAQKITQRTLALKEASLDRDHPSVASELTSLGAISHGLGDLQTARHSYERALRIYETALGPEHPALATVVNNLGSLLAEMGTLQEAKTLFQRALELYKRAGGVHQQAMIGPLVNLSIVLRKEGNLSEARRGLEEALEIAEGSLGADNPKIATILDALGTVLLEAGDTAGAENYYKHALAIAERSYGHTNPLLATYLTNLGSVLKSRGHLAAAEGYLQRALFITQSAYSSNHYRAAAVLHQLGIILAEQGKSKAAQTAFAQALEIHEATLGPNHLEVATDLDSLGLILAEQGELEQARKYHERALHIAEATYGPQHPTLAALLSHTGNVLQQLGELPGALQLQERALEIIESTYGSEHPRTGEIAGALGTTLHRLGERDRARSYYEKALKINEAAQGESHFLTIVVLAHLAALLSESGDRIAARAYFQRAAKAVLQAPNLPPKLTYEINKSFAEVLGDAGDLTRALRALGLATKFATRFDAALIDPLHNIQQRILGAAVAVKRIRVKGYRALQDCEVELGPLQSLLGPNGGGKTSFLDLFVLLQDAGKAQLAQGITNRGGLPTILTRGRESALVVEIEVHLLPEGIPTPGRYLYRLELSSPTGIGHVVTVEEIIQLGVESSAELVLLRRSPSMISFYDLGADNLKEYSLLAVPLKGDESILRQQLPAAVNSTWAAHLCHQIGNRLRDIVFFPPLSIDARSPIRLPQTLQPGDLFPDAEGANLVSVLHQMRAEHPDWYEQVLDALRAGFPGFDRLEFESVAAGQVSMAWHERQFSSPFYVNELSAGTLRFLHLVTILLSPNPPSAVLFDEPEDSLHPHLLVILAELLKQAAGRMQIIAATHSASLIRRFEPAQVIVVDREEGRSTLTCGANMSLEAWLKDYTMDQLWEMGELGGRP